MRRYFVVALLLLVVGVVFSTAASARSGEGDPASVGEVSWGYPTREKLTRAFSGELPRPVLKTWPDGDVSVLVPLRPIAEYLDWRLEWRGDHAIIETPEGVIVVGADVPGVVSWGVVARKDGRYNVVKTVGNVLKEPSTWRDVVVAQVDAYDRLWLGELRRSRLYVNADEAGLKYRLVYDGKITVAVDLELPGVAIDAPPQERKVSGLGKLVLLYLSDPAAVNKYAAEVEAVVLALRERGYPAEILDSVQVAVYPGSGGVPHGSYNWGSCSGSVYWGNRDYASHVISVETGAAAEFRALFLHELGHPLHFYGDPDVRVARQKPVYDAYIAWCSKGERKAARLSTPENPFAGYFNDPMEAWPQAFACQFALDVCWQDIYKAANAKFRNNGITMLPGDYAAWPDDIKVSVRLDLKQPEKKEAYN